MIFKWIGMLEYIPYCTAPAVHWGLLSGTRLTSRIILTEQNIKKQTGPALCVLCRLLCVQDTAYAEYTGRYITSVLDSNGRPCKKTVIGLREE